MWSFMEPWSFQEIKVVKDASELILSYLTSLKDEIFARDWIVQYLSNITFARTELTSSMGPTSNLVLVDYDLFTSRYVGGIYKFITTKELCSLLSMSLVTFWTTGHLSARGRSCLAVVQQITYISSSQRKNLKGFVAGYPKIVIMARLIIKLYI